MPHRLIVTIVTKILLVLAMSIAMVAALACEEDAEEPSVAPTTAAVQPTAPSAAPTTAPAAPTTAAVAPTRAPAVVAPTKAPVVAMPRLPPPLPVDPATAVPPGTDLHDPQQILIPSYHTGNAPWRDGGGSMVFSPWVYGTIYQVNEAHQVRPYIGIGHTMNDDQTVYTVKLRDDAIFQDGTPVTAADFKTYWEHGAKPENIVAWGGASLLIGDIKGWEELRAGDVIEAEGLVVIDDHTLEITTAIPMPTWPMHMAAFNAGISKFDQVTSDPEFFLNPIAAGPYQMSIDPDTGRWAITADQAQWWGPSPTIKKLQGLGVRDRQVQAIMFENGELDMMTLDEPTYGAVLQPSHPWHTLLRVTPAGGLWFIKNKIDLAPLEDLLVRKALAHGADMPSIVKAVWGDSSAHATGLISPQIPCHNPDAPGLIYDPDLAREELSQSTYGSAANLPVLLVDLARPLMVNMGVAVQEYWKDNLGVELDLLKRESGMPRREGSQFYRISLGSMIPDPIQIVSNLTRKDSIEALSNIPGGYPVMDALVEHARTLPIDDPDRCKAWQAVEEEYLDKVYMIPIRWAGGIKWVVQPWVVGFESGFNRELGTMPWMYVLKH